MRQICNQNHIWASTQGVITQQLLTPHQSQYYAWLLTRRAAGDTVESLASTLVDSQVDLNPHQVEAALFACRIRRRRILIIVPANLHKQWHQELQDRFSLRSLILGARNYNIIRKQERQNPSLMASGPVICSCTSLRSPRQTTSRKSTER